MRTILSGSAALVVAGGCLWASGLGQDEGKAFAVEPASPVAEAWLARVPWEDADEEVVQRTRAYLQINTSNDSSISPPGNEAEGAAYLASLLAAEGIDATPIPFAPRRDNLVARLPASQPSGAGAMCLMSHIDVAGVEAERWEQPPFGGVIDDDGVLWGRGAIDMKSVGMLELMSMVWLKRLEVPLSRDLVLIAVGDEEGGSLGARLLADEHLDALGCEHLINEGGMGVVGALVEGLTTFGVSYTEKGSLWLRMVASGEPGHGSTPTPDAAPKRLAEALDKLAQRKPKPVFEDEMHTMLRAVGERAGGITGAVLKSPSLTRSLAKGKLLGNPLTAAMITNTVNVTGFGGGEAPNVVPSEVWAQLDVRLMPGFTDEDLLAELTELVDSEHIRFEVLQYTAPAVSPVDDPVFEALTTHLQRTFPDAAVGPLLMPGTTDSAYFRPHGVRAYGMAPFVFTVDELRGMHGHNERISRENLAQGLRVFLGAMLEVAAAASPEVTGTVTP